MADPNPPSATSAAPVLRSVRVHSFRERFDRLPGWVQRAAKDAFRQFQENPTHPMLHNEALHDTERGRHRSGSRSVWVTFRYRAIYVEDNGLDGRGPRHAVWYWIGSHEDYNDFVGSRRR